LGSWRLEVDWRQKRYCIPICIVRLPTSEVM
jgi:hypothetical protein